MKKKRKVYWLQGSQSGGVRTAPPATRRMARRGQRPNAHRQAKGRR